MFSFLVTNIFFCC